MSSRSQPRMLDCRRCPRLVRHLDEQRALHPNWHNAPVLPWGPANAPLLIVGLAPGRQGANRTGLPFWGDPSGSLLMEALAEGGAADLEAWPPRLQGVRLVNAVACLPPGNRPLASEIRVCADAWLQEELTRPRSLLCLGRIAHESVRRLLGLSRAQLPFSHAAIQHLDEWHIVSSYHPSPLNTRTGRLSRTDFIETVKQALRMAGSVQPG